MGKDTKKGSNTPFFKLFNGFHKFRHENPELITQNHYVFYISLLNYFNMRAWPSKVPYSLDSAIKESFILRRKTCNDVYKDFIKWGFIRVVKEAIPNVHGRIISLQFVQFQSETELKSAWFQSETEVETEVETKPETEVETHNIENQEYQKKQEYQDYSFDEFWNIYDKKSGNKIQSEKLFQKLNKSEIDKLKSHLPEYIKSTPEKKFRKNPETYLRQKHFENEIEFFEQSITDISGMDYNNTDW